MRIAWFTAFGAGTPQGAHGAAVARALATSAEVDVWSADADPLAPTALSVVRYSGRAEPSGYDAIFYNLGGGHPPAPAGPPGISILWTALETGAGEPARGLGLVTHDEADARALAARRLEPVVALRAEPVEDYAAALLRFLDRVARAAPAIALLERLGGELGRMRVSPQHGVYDSLAGDFGRFLVF